MDLDSLDQSYVGLIIHWLDQHNKSNIDLDFSKPYIRSTLKNVYPLFIFIYAIVAVIGTFGNLTMLIVIFRKSLHYNSVFLLLGNLALSDIIKSCVVLPVSVANLLLGNWVFGKFMCYFMPMMQDFPFNGTMLTYILMSVVRYRKIVYPMRSHLPAGLCVIVLWVVSVCLVLPYAVYMKYFDLGKILGPEFEGAGICYVHVERHIEEYIRAMFVCLYVLPLTVVAFLFIRVSAELKSRDNDVHSVVISAAITREDHGNDTTPTSRLTCSSMDASQTEPEIGSPETSHISFNNTRRARTDNDDELDTKKERRAQRFITMMIMLYGICWCPLKILILVTHFVSESSDNSGHFDITYLTFTFIAFASVWINPAMFAIWQMSDRTKNRLKGYFKFSNKGRDSVLSNATRFSSIYTPTHSPPRSNRPV